MQRTYVPTSQHYITAEAHNRCLSTDKIQIGLRGRKQKDGAHPRSLGSRLGPLSIRQQGRRTPRSNHRKQSLQNQQPLLGSILTSTGKQDAHDTKSVTDQHKIQNYGIKRITGFVTKERQRLQTNYRDTLQHPSKRKG